ncbi:MAG: hypothetical protein K1X54_07435 [Flavobacteriales bacterium]|nr:hypothetical protein [Flavobacteriales bacterium]
MKKITRYIRKRWQLWLAIALIGSLLYYFRYDVVDWCRDRFGFELPVDPRPAGVSDLQWCEKNYSEEMAEIAQEFDLPYEYLMALAVLECSGEKPAGNRFEKHIFNQLKKVRDGKQRKLENIKQKDLEQLDDEGLKNLATSWGPFQLMGYKVIPMGVNVADIRSEEQAAYLGAKWIKEEYGHFLRKKKWKDAFHYHNTGQRFPLSGRSKTHDPYYVSDGIKYMKYFEQHKPTQSE